MVSHVLQPFELQYHHEALVALYLFCLLEVDFEVTDQDQVHAVWSVTKCCGDVLGLGTYVHRHS